MNRSGIILNFREHQANDTLLAITEHCLLLMAAADLTRDLNLIMLNFTKDGSIKRISTSKQAHSTKNPAKSYNLPNQDSTTISQRLHDVITNIQEQATQAEAYTARQLPGKPHLNFDKSQSSSTLSLVGMNRIALSDRSFSHLPHLSLVWGNTTRFGKPMWDLQIEGISALRGRGKLEQNAGEALKENGLSILCCFLFRRVTTGRYRMSRKTRDERLHSRISRRHSSDQCFSGSTECPSATAR